MGALHSTSLAVLAVLAVSLVACGSETTSIRDAGTSDGSTVGATPDPPADGGVDAANPSGCPATPPTFNAPCAPSGLGCTYGEAGCRSSASCEGGRWNMEGAPAGPCGDAGTTCSKSGDRCCDPFPGDGPNYCTGGLACCVNVCAATCS
jgi:hypothetical protein